MLENKLIEIGLSKKQAQVYLALLEIGEATVTQIANKSTIHRTTIYDIIPDLVRDGYIKRIVGVKTETFKPEPAEKLPLILERKIRNIKEKSLKAQKLIDQLNLVSSKQPGKPRISIFEGGEGIRTLYEDTLLAHEPIRSFGSTEVLENNDKAFLNNYYSRRAKRKVFIRSIVGDSKSAREYQAKDKELFREIRIVPENMLDIKPEIYIYDNKLAFFSFEEQFAVLVESNDIAYAFKKLHDLAFERAGELDKHK